MMSKKGMVRMLSALLLAGFFQFISWGQSDFVKRELAEAESSDANSQQMLGWIFET